MNLKPNKIWKKLSVGAISTILITLVITNIIGAKINNYYSHLSFMSDLESMVSVAAISLDEPLWNLNTETLFNICDAFFENKAVSQIEVYDYALGIIYERKLDDEAHNELLLTTIEKNIIHNGAKIGYVKFSMTKYFINQKNNQNAKIYFVQMLVLIIILTSVLAIIISRITKPLSTLQLAFKEVGKSSSSFMPQIDISSSDEIGELSHHFNIMSQNIYDARNSVIQLNEDLENKVDIRTKELLDVNENLHQTLTELQEVQDLLIESGKMALLGELVAGVAHEINTPIGVSLTASSFIEKEVKSLIDKSNSGKLTKKDFNSTLDSLNESAAGIVRNLMHAGELVASFKQVAVDQSSHSVRSFNLHHYVNEILLNLNSQFKNRNIELINNCDDDIDLTSYPGAYSQILTNLVMNCLIHAFDNDDEGKIVIAARKKDSLVTISVGDNGKGISNDDISKIFNPFFTTKRGSGGSGLGLNITYNTVLNILKGRIKCVSTLGEGSTFIITVPYKHPDIE
ncbi:MAG: ATP-binding protein [Acidaminobacteraceae bacterium]